MTAPILPSRRGFITGLISLVAAPAIVRAEFKQGYGWTLYRNEYLIDRTFDFRNGGGRTLISNCYIRCCVFLADATSEFVTIEDCWVVHTDMSQLNNARPEVIQIRGNMLHPDEQTARLKCAVPVS